jgi:outer membrane lipoprotein-sorting protein
MACAASLVRADSLDDVLHRMDQAAQKFRSMSASFHYIDYTDLFSETIPADGTVKMVKNGKDKFVLLADFTGRDPHTLHVFGHTAEMYYPKAKSVQVYDTHKVSKSIDQYLFVGFGTTTAELQKTYTVTLGGPEVLDGVKTTRIDLKPNSTEAKNLFNMIQLWIPDGKGNPKQEKVILGKEGKDYKLFQYSNAKIDTMSDPAIPASEFELKVPPGVVRQVMK